MDGVNIISVLSLLVLVGIAGFYQMRIITWTVMLGLGLLFVTFGSQLPFLFLALCWFIYLFAALFANLHGLRQRFIVARALKKLQTQLPTISTTEREALEAGNTWWEKELFCGRPNWQSLLDIPAPTLTADEQQFLDQKVTQLCGMINDWDIITKDFDLPKPVWDYLKQEKFFGMAIPKEYGGLGFSALAHSTVVVKIASRSLSVAVNTMVPNSLGPAELLIYYGTDEQKSYYLPRLAVGEEIPCFALTGPEAGSDAGSIPDTGIICRGEYNGQQQTGILLSWDKRYITLAPIATVLGVAFQLYDPEKLLGDKTDVGITLALIPTSHPGVEVGLRHYPLYQAFMNGPTRGKNVFIPLDWIIGGTKMAGQGWRMLMECLSIGRSISLPALATACGKKVYRYTGAYSRVRRQFNTSISSFEGVEEALANIAGNTYMLEATRIMTAGAVDLKIKPSIASAIAKYHMTEASRAVVAHGMDVHAGHQIQVGPSNFLANMHIAIPISITVEGANILTRNLIIFGQGAIRCHPYLLDEVAIISAPKPDIVALDRVLMAHIGYFISNVIRNIAYSWSGGLFIFTTVKNKTIKKYERQLTRMSAALALLADTSLIYLGGSLKRRERTSARLGDIMSKLYLASATLKYYHDNHCPDSDVDYVCWVIQDCLHKIQIACDELLNNFPNRLIRGLLRFIVFPFGPAYLAPKDSLSHKLLAPMLTLSPLRDRLTQYTYENPDKNDLGNRLDQALGKIDAVEPLWRKLRKEVRAGTLAAHYLIENERIEAAQKAGILSAEEASILREYEALKDEIIKVNEFSFDFKEVIA